VTNRSFLGFVIVLSALTACGQGTSSWSPAAPTQFGQDRKLEPSPPGASRNAHPESLLFACANCYGGTVYFYDGNRRSGPINTLSVENAFAVAVDDAEDIYVSGGGNNGYPVVVTEEYAHGGTITYNDLMIDPVNVAPLEGGQPAFYIANGPTSQVQGPQYLYYPTQGIDYGYGYDDGNLSVVGSATVDFVGDLYLGGYSVGSSGYEVDLATPPSEGTNLGLHLAGQPVGLDLDTQGNLIVDEQYVGVAVFRPGKTTPIKWFDHGKNARPDSITLGNSGKWLYVLDGQHVDTYDYKSGKKLWTYKVPHGPGCCQAEIAMEPRVPLFDPSGYRLTHPGFRYWSKK